MSSPAPKKSLSTVMTTPSRAASTGVPTGIHDVDGVVVLLVTVAGLAAERLAYAERLAVAERHAILRTFILLRAEIARHERVAQAIAESFLRRRRDDAQRPASLRGAIRCVPAAPVAIRRSGGPRNRRRR
jgi:hypothetical protein